MRPDGERPIDGDLGVVTMRVTVVGAGLAGVLLAWRLRGLRPDVQLTLITGPPRPDATGSSGGLVRAFEPTPSNAELAAESMAELVASPVLRRWSAYREIGSTYLLRGAADAGTVRRIEDVLPGSVTLLDQPALASGLPFRRLGRDVVGVAERRAGFLSPGRLRDRILADLRRGGARFHVAPARRIAPDGSVHTGDGTTVVGDVTVVAAGAWTPALLTVSGLPASGLRTKQIQYTRFTVDLPGFGTFVDETTGLYGRPAGTGSFLFGLPCDSWNESPETLALDRALVARVARRVRRQFGVDPVAGDSTASLDCYVDEGGLRLRPTNDAERVYTFTGGSGGAAKTALAASRQAALTLRG